MNKVLLLNIDSKLPNIALKKIEMWHKERGDEIIWDMPMMLGATDKAYASCIFTKNRGVVENYLGLYPELIVGGTGYDCRIKLPSEIDGMRPKCNYGFTTRGCPRKCPFCLVNLAEGDVYIEGDFYDIWDGKSKWVIYYDNNPLALLDHFELVSNQSIREGVAIDYNQGLDIRFITRHIIEILNKLKLKAGLRFAFDSPSLEPIIRRKVALLRKYYNRKYIFFYVLVGFSTTFEEDLHRCNVLRELGCRSYVMRHENTPKEKRYIRLAEWCNQFWTFAKYNFDDFCVEYDKQH